MNFGLSNMCLSSVIMAILVVLGLVLAVVLGLVLAVVMMGGGDGAACSLLFEPQLPILSSGNSLNKIVTHWMQGKCSKALVGTGILFLFSKQISHRGIFVSLQRFRC